METSCGLDQVVSLWFGITLVCGIVATFSWFFLKFFLNTTSLLLDKIYSHCLFYNPSGVWIHLNCINVKQVWYLVDAGGKNRRPAWGIRGERFCGWKKPVEVSRMICRIHISGYGSLLTLHPFCRYSTFVNWELWWPNFPILVYFKETQTKPEGQVHFFPVIFVSMKGRITYVSYPISKLVTDTMCCLSPSRMGSNFMMLW